MKKLHETDHNFDIKKQYNQDVKNLFPDDWKWIKSAEVMEKDECYYLSFKIIEILERKSNFVFDYLDQYFPLLKIKIGNTGKQIFVLKKDENSYISYVKIEKFDSRQMIMGGIKSIENEIIEINSSSIKKENLFFDEKENTLWFAKSTQKSKLIDSIRFIYNGSIYLNKFLEIFNDGTYIRTRQYLKKMLKSMKI